MATAVRKSHLDTKLEKVKELRRIGANEVRRTIRVRRSRNVASTRRTIETKIDAALPGGAMRHRCVIAPPGSAASMARWRCFGAKAMRNIFQRRCVRERARRRVGRRRKRRLALWDGRQLTTAVCIDAASRRGESLSGAEQPPIHSVLVPLWQTHEEVVRTRRVGPNV